MKSLVVPPPPPPPEPEGFIDVGLADMDEISTDELEAHFEVENLLNESNERAENGDGMSFLEESAESMQKALSSRDPEQSSLVETSKSGSVRGYSAGLMRQLTLMYQYLVLCKSDKLTEVSEQIGIKLIRIEKQLEIQLTHLDKYLASIFWAFQEGCEEGSDKGFQIRRPETSNKRNKGNNNRHKDDSNCFSQVLRSIFD